MQANISSLMEEIERLKRMVGTKVSKYTLKTINGQSLISQTAGNIVLNSEVVSGLYRAISAPTIITTNDETIHILSGSFTQILPQIETGKSFEFINTGNVGSITITPPNGTINNGTSILLPPGHSVTVKSTGNLTGITYVITSQY